ncbi:MAG: hypothetical protein M0Q93_05080, partial [Terrimicrobiaceae bacterium]|nr:hypothetical protein [Terrimicrobiaceae bacterium]
ATAQEAAETAKREAEAKKQADAIRVAQEAEQQKQMQQQAQSSAQQASGGSPGSVKMAAAAAQTGAGMTASPFKSAIDTARKSGNQFYSTGQSRFGGY